MKLTKDEARILAEAMNIAKYEFRKTENLFDRLTDLEKRLKLFGKDKRRTGRTSMDDFTDCIKRFASTNHAKLQ